MLQDFLSLEAIQLINQNKYLEEWFKTNEEMLVKNNLTNQKSLYLVDFKMTNDIRVLRQMIGVCLNWLEGDYPLNSLERITKSINAIKKIYELEKKNLSNMALSQFKISADESQSNKILTKHNGIKNNRPGKGKRNH